MFENIILRKAAKSMRNGITSPPQLGRLYYEKL